MSLIRIWCRAALCGLIAMVVSVSADTTPQTVAPSKKKTAHHLTITSKASKHRATTHSSASKASIPKTKHALSKIKSKGKKRGQQAIDSERARQIQQALIREHYLQGEPSGAWDAATQAAMQRYQSDQGWQTKTIPDSRALIKLGLGPSVEHLLNPESAMTSSVAKASAKVDSKSGVDDPSASPSGPNPVGDPPQR